MTLAVILVIVAAFIWALTNHTDKFLVSGIDDSANSIKTLFVISTFVAGLVLMPLWLIISKFSVEISFISFVFVFGGTFSYSLACLSYFKALEKSDASSVIAMSQIMPVFSYIFGLLFFKEIFTFRQLIGSIVIVLSTILISLDFSEHNKKDKFIALALTLLSSLLGAFYWILLDFALRGANYNSCLFWQQVSFVIIGLCALCFSSIRESFITSIKNNGKKYIILNLLNEALNLIGYFLVNYANLLIPVALANVLSGFQAMFVFVIGAIGSVFFPKFFKEDLSKIVVIQKVGCILLGIIGLVIIFM